jgi:hypothetical protein
MAIAKNCIEYGALMTVSAPKIFCLAGPCHPKKHYMLSAARMPDVKTVIDKEKYFVICTPRQSGKTTTIGAYTDEINNERQFYALSCSLQTVDGVDEPSKAVAAILHKMELDLGHSSVKALNEIRAYLPKTEFEPATAILDTLRSIRAKLDKDLIIFFDDAYCLTDDVLINYFLRQLQNGYENRHKVPFIRSIAIAGLSDIRKYKGKYRPEPKSIISESPIDVITEALTLPNFTKK